MQTAEARVSSLFLREFPRNLVGLKDSVYYPLI